MICELCESSVANFNQHMKKNHPGCGRSANRQGYRSNGSYVDGWFGGECGSGNPYYLLCGSCREKYLSMKSKAKGPSLERQVLLIFLAELGLVSMFQYLIHCMTDGFILITLCRRVFNKTEYCILFRFVVVRCCTLCIL